MTRTCEKLKEIDQLFQISARCPILVKPGPCSPSQAELILTGRIISYPVSRFIPSITPLSSIPLLDLMSSALDPDVPVPAYPISADLLSICMVIVSLAGHVTLLSVLYCL